MNIHMLYGSMLSIRQSAKKHYIETVWRTIAMCCIHLVIVVVAQA